MIGPLSILVLALSLRALGTDCPVWFKVPDSIDTTEGKCISEGCHISIFDAYDVPKQILQKDGINPFSSVQPKYIRVDVDQAKYTGYSGQGAAQAWSAIHQCAHSNLSAALLSGFHALTNGGIALSMVMDGPEKEQLEARIRRALARAEGLNVTEDLSATCAADMGLRLRGETMLYHSLLKHPDRVDALRLLTCFLMNNEDCEWYKKIASENEGARESVSEDLHCALEQLNHVSCLHCRLFAAVDLTGIIASLRSQGELTHNEVVAQAYVRQHAQLVMDEVEYRLGVLRSHCPGFADVDTLDDQCRECLSNLCDVEDVCDADFAPARPTQRPFWRRLQLQFNNKDEL